MVTEQNIDEVLAEAHRQGMAALQAANPQPMVVTDGQHRWTVPGGPCGFAWVNIRGVRSNSRVGRRLTEQGFQKSYSQPGLQYWVHEGNQSMELKEAYADAFAKVLKSQGLDASVGSRMD
jgi:hypothetical protein